MSFGIPDAERTPSISMPPYSTDPQLSFERHADPEYINSSDPTDLSLISSERPDTFPSSPPRIDTDVEMEIDPPTDEDQMTDEDEYESVSAAPQSTITTAANHPETYYQPATTFKKLSYRSSFILAARSESSIGRRTPESIVSAVFDSDKKTNMIFEDMGLEKVPTAIHDLIGYEDLANRMFNMDFTNNCFTRLDRCIYDITRLEYLSLRSNNLVELSPLISNLVNLCELHLGHNRLKTLPIELLELPKLRTLTTYPNEFIPIPKSGTTFVRNFTTPPLKEFAQRKLINLVWELPPKELEVVRSDISKQFSNLIHPVFDANEMGRICSVCRSPMVEPCAYSLTWKRHGQDRSGEMVPFIKTMCSPQCASE